MATRGLQRRRRRRALESLSRFAKRGEDALQRERRRVEWKREHVGTGTRLDKRDLSGRANGTIDPWYGCFIYDEMIDYALNYTYPWGRFSEESAFSFTKRAVLDRCVRLY